MYVVLCFFLGQKLSIKLSTVDVEIFLRSVAAASEVQPPVIETRMLRINLPMINQS